MGGELRAAIVKFGGALIVGIGIVSGAFQVFNLPGGLWPGLASVLAIGIVSAVMFLFKPWKLRLVRYMTLDSVLRNSLGLSREIRCVFSAGDEFRQVLEGGLFRQRVEELSAGTTVQLVYRLRNGPDEHHVMENLERIRVRLSEVGVRLEARGVAWDHFMIGGIMFGDSAAAVKFYYRHDDRTAAVDQRYAFIRSARGGYDFLLFCALKAEFDALWLHSTDPSI